MTGLSFGQLFRSDTGDPGIRKKSQFLSLHPSAFKGMNPDVDNMTYNAVKAEVDGGVVSWIIAPIQIPDGATILGGQLYGEAALSNNNWSLTRSDIPNTTSDNIIATTVNSYGAAVQDKADIDNRNWVYHLMVIAPDVAAEFWGGWIEYSI